MRDLRSPRWAKVRRDAWQHKSRTILVTLAIAVGIVGAGAVLDAWSLLRRVTRGEYEASHPPSATLETDALDPELLHRVRALPGIEAAQARRTVLGSIKTPAGFRTAVLFTTDDFTANRIGVVKPESGAWPPPEGALVVEASSLDFAGTAVGESLEVQLRDGEPALLPVLGVARDVGLAPGWMEHVVYGFATPSTLASLGAPSTLNELRILAPGDRDAIRRTALEVQALLQENGHAVTKLDVPIPGRHIHAAQIDSLLFTQGAFGVLAMLLSGILVVNLVAAMLAGQVREIGVMKAIGAQASQIAALYLGLALVLGLAACAIAIPAAAFLGRQYAQFTADTLNFDIAGFEIPPLAILLQLAVGALLPVASAAIPVARGCRTSVAAALRDLGIEAPPARLPTRSFGLPRPFLLSLRNAFRRRERLLLTLTTLATGGAVYIGALDLRAAIRGSVDLLFDSQRFDLVLAFERAWHPDSLEAQCTAIAGVEAAEAWGGSRAALDGSPSESFPVMAPPTTSQLFAPKFQSGGWGEGNSLVVNRRLVLSEPRLAEGRELTLLLDGRPSVWRVTGIVDTGPSPMAYARREALARVQGEARVTRLMVRSALPGPASHLDLVQRLRSDLASQGYAVRASQLMVESRRVMEDHLLMVAGFLGVMSQLMIVVGGLGLASTMSLAVLERTREIGVLRAIGARHTTILTLVTSEGLVVSLLGWALAIPLSLPMSLVLGHAFGRIMLPVPVRLLPEPTALLQWLAISLLVSLLASLWPALRATRLSTRTALSYE